MKNYSVGKYIALVFVGLCIFAAGIILLRFVQDPAGLMKTVPYVCIGVGSGIIGGNLGTAINNGIMRKYPQAAKKAEIETKDERNTAIRNKAKAKSYDLMVMVFGALMLALALMQIDLYVILTFVAAYLFVVAANSYYLIKFQKEM